MDAREMKLLARVAKKTKTVGDRARADAWLEKVERYFEYLQIMYGFRIALVDASSVWETRVIYQTEKTAIYVDRSLEFFRVKVSLVRLIDGALPPYPIFIKPDTVLHEFLLDDLLALRGSPLL